jgi:hypothetical protein
MDAADGAVAAFVARMPKLDKWLIKSWRDAGFDWMDSIAESQLLVGGRRHPAQAAEDPYVRRLRQLQTSPAELADREAAEYEAAHCWTALARGMDLVSVRLDGSGGLCRYIRSDDPIDNAAVSVAGELWISMFRSDEFPGGALGCSEDRRDALRTTGDVTGDWELREARQRAHTALVTYGADVLSLADRLQRDRMIVFDD